LKTPSKFFYSNNQIACSRFYERYRVENRETKLTSIIKFENLLYYHLLKITNSSNVKELNQKLSIENLTFNITDITKTLQLVTSKKEVNDDYKKEVYAVIDTPSEIGKKD
jgi:hypothetical protein